MFSPSYKEVGIVIVKREGILTFQLFKHYWFHLNCMFSPRVSDTLVHEGLEDTGILRQVPVDPPHVADGSLTPLTGWGRVTIEQDFP